MLQNIRSLRGIFVIFIFLSHLEADGSAMMPCGGDCGVAFFMMLSGFVLSAGYEQKISKGLIGRREFMTRRLKKLYPLHLLCFVWAALLFLPGSSFGAGTAAKAAINLSMLQSWTLLPSYYFSFNAVSWFLSDVMFFYLLFPTAVRLKIVYRPWFIGAFAAVCQLYICLIPMISDPHANSAVYIFPPSRLLDFMIGMSLWRLYKARHVISRRFGQLSERQWVTDAVELIAVAVLVIWTAVYDCMPYVYRLGVYWWPCMATVILTFSITEGRGGLISRVLACRPLQRLGSVSFAFYMVHLLCIESFTRLTTESGITPSPAAALVICGTMTLLLAFASHRLPGVRSEK